MQARTTTPARDETPFAYIKKVVPAEDTEELPLLELLTVDVAVCRRQKWGRAGLLAQ